jgi:hypothetical protein
MSAKKTYNSSSDPIFVSEESIRIYEQSSGFTGIGKIMLHEGLWIILNAPEKNS